MSPSPPASSPAASSPAAPSPLSPSPAAPLVRRPDESGSETAGLSATDAARRLETDGPNLLPTPARVPAWRQLAAEMVHFFALLFWVAGILAFVAGLPQLGIAVFLVVVLNGVFAFAQERRAEHAAEKLRDLLPREATVVRDGLEQQVSADQLVRGDLVVLAEGDKVSADLHVDVANALAVDASMLTGESVPEHPDTGDVVHAGSFVVEGEGRATVVATGGGTRLAGIADLTSGQVSAPTPLRKELVRVSRLIAAIAVGVGLAFFGVSFLLGMPARNGFLFAVGVTVALVPEGLLPTITLSLAVGAQRMSRSNALVRHLEAVETLGSTTFICTDKTGTLTRNEMTVVEVWMPSGTAVITGEGYGPTAQIDCHPATARDDLDVLALVAARCSSGGVVCLDDQWTARGDPMEAALIALANRVGADTGADRRATAESARFPFDARRRRMSVVVGGRVFTKGAPDSVLPLCDTPPGAETALLDLADRGLRVLAIATRELAGESAPETADDAERNLTLLGLVALEDPPRAEVRDAIERCRGAGIRVAMITGDHPATARAIAAEVGLLVENAPVLVGAELPTDDAEMGALIDHDGVVIARVEPEDKLRIAQALEHRGHVVAMTGDGVNDAPALRAASIGVAMGRSGTDVARDAADLVLLDDNFATIVVAVEQGRATFSNIRRFLTYHLTDNVAELTPFVVWALSGGRFPLAIGVLQVLALDIGTDVLPALALGTEAPAKHVLDGPPVQRHLLDRPLLIRAFGILGPVEALVEMAAFVAVFFATGWRPGDPFPTGAVLLAASGAAFTAVVLGQFATAFACRSTIHPVWAMKWSSNRLLVAAVAIEVVMLGGFLFIGPLARVLGHRPPTLAGFGVALLAMPAVLVADSIQKAIIRRRLRQRNSVVVDV